MDSKKLSEDVDDLEKELMSRLEPTTQTKLERTRAAWTLTLMAALTLIVLSWKLSSSEPWTPMWTYPSTFRPPPALTTTYLAILLLGASASMTKYLLEGLIRGLSRQR